jgi:hypothetical protein
MNGLAGILFQMQARGLKAVACSAGLVAVAVASAVVAGAVGSSAHAIVATIINAVVSNAVRRVNPSLG